jgi:hypothetical protein
MSAESHSKSPGTGSVAETPNRSNLLALVGFGLTRMYFGKELPLPKML